MRSLRGADGLRAIACLMVIFHHLTQKLHLTELPPLLRGIADFLITGSAGVSVFFILSGFLLAVPFWEAYLDGNERPNLKIYAARRAGRILPGFLVNMAFCFFLGIFLFPDAPSLVWRYLSGLTFTSSFHWLTFFPSEMNGPLWSIGFEVVSYILMPIGMILLFSFLGDDRSFKKAFVFWLKIWVVAAMLNEMIIAFVETDAGGKGWQYGVVGGAKYWMPRYNPIGFFGHFTLGVLGGGLSVWWSRVAYEWKAWQRWHLFDIASLVCFGLWLALLWGRGGQWEFSLNLQGQPYYYPTFGALTALLLACLTQSKFMGKAFDNPVCRYLARISFGLYLWHYLVIFGIEKIYPAYSYGHIKDLGIWALLAAITLIVSIAIASASWFWFEKPILARAQAWKPRAPAEKFRWTRFSALAMAIIGVLVIVPPAMAAIVRPNAWAFLPPFFPVRNENLVIPEGRGSITLKITGERNKTGSFVAGLYIKDWSEFNLVSTKTVILSQGDTVEFTDIPFGEYAIRGFHDENLNGRQDMVEDTPVEGIIMAARPLYPDDFPSFKFFFNKPEFRLEYTVHYYPKTQVPGL